MNMRHARRPVDAPSPATRTGTQIRSAGVAIAGVVCLSLIVGGSWLAVLFAMALTREFGVDTQGIRLEDVVGSVILSLPGFGLAFLGVWLLRKSGRDRTGAWACLLTAAAIVAFGVAGIVLALSEFAKTEGAGPVLASRWGGVLGLAIAAYLAWAGLRFRRANAG